MVSAYCSAARRSLRRASRSRRRFVASSFSTRDARTNRRRNCSAVSAGSVKRFASAHATTKSIGMPKRWARMSVNSACVTTSSHKYNCVDPLGVSTRRIVVPSVGHPVIVTQVLTLGLGSIPVCGSMRRGWNPLSVRPVRANTHALTCVVLPAPLGIVRDVNGASKTSNAPNSTIDSFIRLSV